MVANGSALLLLGIERNHRDLVRGNGDRPDDTVLDVYKRQIEHRGRITDVKGIIAQLICLVA